MKFFPRGILILNLCDLVVGAAREGVKTRGTTTPPFFKRAAGVSKWEAGRAQRLAAKRQAGLKLKKQLYSDCEVHPVYTYVC